MRRLGEDQPQAGAGTKRQLLKQDNIAGLCQQRIRASWHQLSCPHNVREDSNLGGQGKKGRNISEAEMGRQSESPYPFGNRVGVLQGRPGSVLPSLRGAGLTC